jgi:hypothetical protein
MTIHNAVIRSVSIDIEDHGMLTAWVNLDYGDSCQGFGGYALDCGSSCGKFVRKTLETVGVDSWEALKGQTIRVRRGNKCNDLVEAIGHIIKDKWFEPKKELTE